MRCLLPLLLLTACSDDTLYVMGAAPAVTIDTPVEGEAYDEGTAVEFTGYVDDDTPPEDLLVEWVSSIDGSLPDDDGADTDGFVDYVTASLTPGTHVVTLRATDLDDRQGEDTVTFDILEVTELPSIEIEHPTEDEVGLEDSAFVFMAEVDDYHDLPEDLEVSLSSNPGGHICFMTVDGYGNAQCSATLDVATYMLTFKVEDTDGNEASAQIEFQVVSADDYDYDGDGYSTNGGDCNDSNADIYPGAPEICDGLDNDCDETTAIDVGTECYDDDGDGYCEDPPCTNTDYTEEDCDDTDPDVSPASEEVVNGADDDCNGYVDDGTVVYDDDGDGYCESPECENTANMESDCDDTDPDIYPTATEVCDDGIDNNCDGDENELDAIGCTDFYYDDDGDTYGVSGVTECWCEDGRYPYTGLTANDCYDSNAYAYPGQTTFFSVDRGDGSFDYDCSGSEEKEYTDISSGCAWDITYITCECDAVGWDGSVPGCGISDLWIEDCSATYDPLCYAACLLTADIIDCLINTCGATCDPEYQSYTQACR